MRHGEPLGGSRYRGQIDDPLSDKGWQQMRDALAGYSLWDAVVTSPLVRCCAFAEELAGAQQLPLAIEADFKELGFGSWEGKTRAELAEIDPQQLQRFYQDPIKYRPEGAEALADFSARVSAAWQRIADAQHGEHLLLVAHAGVIRVLICHALGLPVEQMFRLQVSNASISRIILDQRCPPVLQFHNGRLGIF
ncbi:MAG: alpha-ribazole phosphatase family protein [Thiotrichaceae bacterium]|nr:alpha-ribazole phosphatase family protein [Thiotrichaceae bacterium]PCI14718.1 MAG: histidine phosphatase family protein [Thiotrichales bacterium]